MGLTLARWMVALGAVVGSVGFTLLGMAMSYVRPDDGLFTLGLVLMIGGIVVFALGMLAHHRGDRPDRSGG